MFICTDCQCLSPPRCIKPLALCVRDDSASFRLTTAIVDNINFTWISFVTGDDVVIHSSLQLSA